jgi:hypothetical protein
MSGTQARPGGGERTSGSFTQKRRGGASEGERIKPMMRTTPSKGVDHKAVRLPALRLPSASAEGKKGMKAHPAPFKE